MPEGFLRKSTPGDATNAAQGISLPFFYGFDKVDTKKACMALRALGLGTNHVFVY